MNGMLKRKSIRKKSLSKYFQKNGCTKSIERIQIEKKEREIEDSWKNILYEKKLYFEVDYL